MSTNEERQSRTEESQNNNDAQPDKSTQRPSVDNSSQRGQSEAELIKKPKGRPRPNPTDFRISLGAKLDSDQQLLSPNNVRQQSMRGFDDTYVDIVDFIVRATHRIWEEKDIGYIYENYRHNIRITNDYGVQYGRDKVVADTAQFISAFPDIRIYADEIVWAGNDEVGFHTSHRGVIKGTNTGYSKFGPPTGREIHMWSVANCLYIANENHEEWVIENHSSLIRQLGFDLRQKAREFGNRVNWEEWSELHFGESDRLPGQNRPSHIPADTSGEFSVDSFIQHAYHYIWNWRNVGKVRDVYASNLRYFGPTDRRFYGRGEYQAFVLSMIAMFPDLTMYIDDVYWMGNEREGYITSVRWTLVGTHKGYGIYGPPTNRPVHMWGITQHRVKDSKILEEWMMFNEFEVMQQIYHDQT